MIRRLRRTGVLVAVSLTLPLLGLKLISFTGTAPARPSLVDALPGCPPTPNCVSSTDPDEAHQVAPLPLEGDPAAAWAVLESVLGELGGVPVRVEDRYRHYAFRSRWMGFVDDVEFLLNQEENRFEVRSASRSGYGDFGVNRRRVERIRAGFTNTTK